MKTKKYKTLKGLASQSTQLTFKELLTGRFYHKKLGWINFKIDNLDQIIEDVAYNVIGGRKVNSVINGLNYGLNRHWALDRIIYCKYRNQFHYVAGQDGAFELNELRKYLYNK